MCLRPTDELAPGLALGEFNCGVHLASEGGTFLKAGEATDGLWLGGANGEGEEY